jgi:hypothetical protein
MLAWMNQVFMWMHETTRPLRAENNLAQQTDYWRRMKGAVAGVLQIAYECGNAR